MGARIVSRIVWTRWWLDAASSRVFCPPASIGKTVRICDELIASVSPPPELEPQLGPEVVGKIIEFFPDNLTKREVSTPGPCFAFGARIPGGMSGGPIFNKERAYVHGVVSKGWENEDGPENFSFGSAVVTLSGDVY